MTYAFAKRDLNKAGITFQSITQPLNDDSMGRMVETILVGFDAYTSNEIGKHTARGMKENARQGFWNGSRPPFGYAAVEAERRGDKVKKKLAIDEMEARLVRRIFDMYCGAEGVQRGVKAIASTLNTDGETFRGKSFMISNIHRILTSETYMGRHYFNIVKSKTGSIRPKNEWIAVDVPVIIAAETWETVQVQLAERAPKKTPARIVNSPTLLTGIAVCAKCGAGMTLRTGKGYRYYACAGRAQKGPARCGGCAVSMPKVDAAVLDCLSDKIFRPDRLKALVSGYLEQTDANAEKNRAQAGRLRGELSEIEGAINRLLGMVEAGLMEIGDPALRDRLNILKAKRSNLEHQLKESTTTSKTSVQMLTETKLAKLSSAIRIGLHDSAPELRKAYLKLFVDKVVISRDKIEVSGPCGALAQAALGDLPKTASEVITFVREWRPVGDSNPCRRRERAVS